MHLRPLLIPLLFVVAWADGNTCTMHVGKQALTLHPYAGSLTNNSDACCATCQSDTKCGAWTWRTNGNCLLAEEAAPHGSGKNIDASGSKKPLPPPTPPTPKPKPTPPPALPTPALPPIKPHPPLGKQPNIVLFLQDDQDLFLGGWTPMKQANELVNKQGATASNWWVGFPAAYLPCPNGSILNPTHFMTHRLIS